MKLSDELSRQPFALRGWHIREWRLGRGENPTEAVILAERIDSGFYRQRKEWVTAWMTLELFRSKPIGGSAEWTMGNYFINFDDAHADYDKRCRVTPDYVADAG
jgi:hypothetical protein